MDEIFTIEEGIAIPPKATGRAKGSGKWEKLTATMSLTTENIVGSSILLTGAKSKKKAAAIRRAFNEQGFNIVTRQEGDGIRSWKIAK